MMLREGDSRCTPFQVPTHMFPLLSTYRHCVSPLKVASVFCAEGDLRGMAYSFIGLSAQTVSFCT